MFDPYYMNQKLISKENDEANIKRFFFVDNNGTTSLRTLSQFIYDKNGLSDAE